MGRVLMMRGRGGGVPRRHRRHRYCRHRCRRAAKKNISKQKFFNKISYMATIFFDRISTEYFTWTKNFS